MCLVPQVCGKETDGPPDRQETPPRPWCSISPTEQKLYTVAGRITHTVTLKAQKEIYCTEWSKEKRAIYSRGCGWSTCWTRTTSWRGQKHWDQGRSPCQRPSNENDRECLAAAQPSYDQSNKQQVTAVEYCWETSKSVERDSPKGKPKEKMETWGWKRD